MSTNTKGIIFFAVFFILIIASMVITTYLDNRQAQKDQKEISSLTGNVEFKGKVISSKVYQFGGKNYHMICVKLDYSNVKDFSVLNDLCAIKIKNNIATMAAGFLSSDNGVVDYVECNIGHNGQERFIYKNKVVLDFEFSLANKGLTEQDMNFCN